MTTPPGPPRLARAAVPDWKRDSSFRPPERVPWSVLGPQFALAYGRADPSDPQPEHLEIIGQNGSGKTHLLGKIYQERAFVQQRPSVIVALKGADATLAKIGFPIVTTWDELVKSVRDGQPNVIFWPRTNRMGSARRAWHEARVRDLLERLWTPEADTDVAVDDWGYAEELGEVRQLLHQYLREGRSHGLAVAAMKQRPQGSTRLMSSETQWTAGFKPKDRDDLERWAQLFGAPRDWVPVMDGMDNMKREFLIRHNRTGDAYISWVDEPLKPVNIPKRRKTMAAALGLRRG